MRYSIVYCSRTGNTKQIAEAIYAQLPAGDVVYMGVPCEEALNADVLFVGSWTDKGTCDPSVADFLSKTEHKTVFLFGTSGFGQSKQYFKQILQRVKELLPQTTTTGQGFMCQGKMPMAVRQRYQAMLEQEPENARFKMMIENFDAALEHPNAKDLEEAAAWARSCVEQL